MIRPLTGALLFCATQLIPPSFAQGIPALPAITLDAAQQATLGVRTTAVQHAGQQQLLASATVTVPPGQEVTVAAPFAGVSRGWRSAWATAYAPARRWPP